MFLLKGRLRKEIKNLIAQIPEEKKRELLNRVEKILLEALKVYVESLTKK